MTPRRDAPPGRWMALSQHLGLPGCPPTEPRRAERLQCNHLGTKVRSCRERAFGLPSEVSDAATPAEYDGPDYSVITCMAGPGSAGSSQLMRQARCRLPSAGVSALSLGRRPVTLALSRHPCWPRRGSPRGQHHARTAALSNSLCCSPRSEGDYSVIGRGVDPARTFRVREHCLPRSTHPGPMP